MNTNDSNEKRLQELKGSNYEIADGQPDIRGWSLKDSDGALIGEIDELIFDVESRKVRYMVVNLDDDFTNSRSKDVLVPIGLAELDKVADDAYLPRVTREQVNGLPAYEGEISNNTEQLIRNAFLGAGAVISGNSKNDGTSDPLDFYDHEHFDEGNLMKRRKGEHAEGTIAIPIIEEELEVGKRTVETGGATIKSRIVEREVQENVNLNEEQVYVERNTVNRAANENDFEAFKEGVIELKEYAEVPVVTKTARVVEEIKISTDVEERTETIRETLRKTEVDFENLEGNVDKPSGNIGKI